MRGEFREKPAPALEGPWFPGQRDNFCSSHCPSLACTIPESVEAQRQQVLECQQDRTNGLVQMGEGGGVRKSREAAPG